MWSYQMYLPCFALDPQSVFTVQLKVCSLDGLFLPWQFPVPVGTQDKIELLKEIITLLTNTIYKNSSYSTENVEASFLIILYQEKLLNF